ncbi:TRM11 family SAM-dependent methyltransferase [Pseudonocardia nigra]|uniref:TRM11 family SAM-dependent methyltransferase n=1 Tax=Pseudonocardia nigra TaxID=1921578 RepID=UPI001C6003D6|nr:DNA methyltransferase [Pseudonocardia nigra]
MTHHQQAHDVGETEGRRLRGGLAAGAVGAVWLTGQQPPRTQRLGRYLPESTAHPAKMLPAVAAHAITTYTAPGELVFDPMCGIGTTLVEAVRAGRAALGVEYEPRWAAVATGNLDLAAEHGHTTPGRVVRGDARQLARLLPEQLHGQVALIVTSPPYGPSTHGHLAGTRGGPIHKINHRYGNTLDRGNLANIGHHRLLGGFTRILTAAVPFLRPGGRVVITVRPWREHAELIDLPAQIAACGQRTGLTLVDRCVALLGRVTADGDFVARGSFFQRDFIAKQRRAGLPLHLIAHEDVLILQRPHAPRETAGASPLPPVVIAQGALARDTDERQSAAA